jgi:lipopolysaccharide biosynthesis glycosyltransferase
MVEQNMKTFPQDFFDEKNFLKSVQTFDYLPPDSTGNSYHICYNVNDGFFPVMSGSLVSILENNKDAKIIFHIFTDGCSAENTARVEKLAKEWQIKCILYTVNIEPFKDFHIKVKRFVHITYARIYMPKILKKYTKRFLYIDADTMCVNSLSQLFATDMGGKAMGAVSDVAEVIGYRAGYLKLTSGKYFNDGVMLIDIEPWENGHYTEKAFSYQKEPKERFLGHDQDILNLTFDGQNYSLPAGYNAFNGDVADNSEKYIVHWIGRRKPWQMVLTDLDAQWRTYNKLSPWDTITNILPIKKPENYHDFKQWALYQKEHGNLSGYLSGLLWYGILKTKYKLGKRS